MKIDELMDLAKRINNLESDYGLHKAADISKQRISAYRNNREIPGIYEVAKLALLAKRDPLECIAEVQAETEKNEKKREFWRDFRQHAGKAAMIVMALSFTISSAQDADAFERNSLTNHPIMRS